VRELSLHILDILENSLEAGASRIELEITEDHGANRLIICVIDNGRGMDAETLKRVSDPFFTTRKTRHVGLGIPLFQAAAQRCNGNLVVTSQPGVGTQVVADFQWDHIDRAPLGDMRNTLLSVLLAHGECTLRYRHQVDEREFAFDTAEMRAAMGSELSFSHPRVRAWLQDFLDEGFAELYGDSHSILQ
jgi:anti-sigma regulatory factor (Ser/Thr protein kinase)